jgi:hypothetical protein
LPFLDRSQDSPCHPLLRRLGVFRASRGLILILLQAAAVAVHRRELQVLGLIAFVAWCVVVAFLDSVPFVTDIYRPSQRVLSRILLSQTTNSQCSSQYGQ